jgi:3-oxo-5-alpha-steroid 4-dehydrogenase 3
VLSLVLSAVAFTLVQLRQSGYQLLVFDILKTSNHGNISIEISRLVAFLIVGHSLRRLSETIMMMNYQRSKSKMNISHYLVGLFFYSSLNLQLVLNTNFDDVEVSPQAYSMTDLNFSILIPVLLFFLASSSQFLNHLHLSKLLKYTIPSFGMFKFLCCAHYFDEILIYVSIFALLQNLTSLLALIWVIVNLSVSSIETRAYYKKNGDGKVPKWCIIPFIL